MNITLFNKEYLCRRFEEQEELNGYLYSKYNDFIVSLNLHPLSTNQILALPEGERSVKRLEAQSSVPLKASDTASNTKGDMVFYDGEWYECISSQYWGHTILKHWNLQFVVIPSDSPQLTDISSPPKMYVDDYNKILVDDLGNWLF